MIFPPFRLFARIFSRKPPHNTFLRVLPRRCHRVHRPRRQSQPNFALHAGAAKFRQNVHAAFLRPPGQQGADGPLMAGGQTHAAPGKGKEVFRRGQQSAFSAHQLHGEAQLRFGTDAGVQHLGPLSHEPGGAGVPYGGGCSLRRVGQQHFPGRRDRDIGLSAGYGVSRPMNRKAAAPEAGGPGRAPPQVL